MHKCCCGELDVLLQPCSRGKESRLYSLSFMPEGCEILARHIKNTDDFSKGLPGIDAENGSMRLLLLHRTGGAHCLRSDKRSLMVSLLPSASLCHLHFHRESREHLLS